MQLQLAIRNHFMLTDQKRRPIGRRFFLLMFVMSQDVFHPSPPARYTAAKAASRCIATVTRCADRRQSQ